MAIKSPSLLWNIGQDLGKGDKEQARSNAGVDSIKRSDKIEHQFLTHIAENATSGNLEAKYAQPVIGDVSGLSTALSNLKTFYATKSTTFNELLTAYNNGQTLLLLADYTSSQGSLYKNYIFTLGWISKPSSTIDAFEFIAIEHFATTEGGGNTPEFTKSIRVAAWTCRSGTNWDADPYINWVDLATTEYADYNVSPTFQSGDVTVATGDKLLISDASDDGKEVRSGISFSTIAAENLFLNERGAWKSALPTIYNTDASTSVHWDDLDDEGFYSVLHSPSPTDDSTSPEQHDMFALVGNSGTVGGTYRAQLAMGDSLFYRHTTGANNVNWTDWHTVLAIGSQNIGNAPPYGNYQPVYIKDGEVTACPMLFGELSSENGDGITLRYDSTNNWYCIGTMSYTAFNKYVETTGTNPDIVPEHFEFEKASTLVFGDGFGVGTNQPNYWGLAVKSHSTGGTRFPLVIEAPSVTYAYTSLSNSCFEKGNPGDTRLEIEFWNEHRIKDYLVCCQYRNGSAASTSYICSTSFSTLDGDRGIDLCLIPPHHWGFANGCITGSSLHQSTYTNMLAKLVNGDTSTTSYNYIEVPPATYEGSQAIWDSLSSMNYITLTSETASASLRISTIWKPNEISGRPSGAGSDTFLIKFANGSTVPGGYYDMSFVTGEQKYQGNIDFTFALLSTQNNQTYYQLGSYECVGIAYSSWSWGGVTLNNSIMPCTFSFFCYNPTNENKYISCCVSNSLPASYSLHKQLLICKTPELGGFNWPYVAPPANRPVPEEN